MSWLLISGVSGGTVVHILIYTFSGVASYSNDGMSQVPSGPLFSDRIGE